MLESQKTADAPSSLPLGHCELSSGQQDRQTHFYCHLNPYRLHHVNAASGRIAPTQSPNGGSKAALNWFIRRLHFEEPWLISFIFHPGLVETNLAVALTKDSSLQLSDLGAIIVETSVTSMVKTIDNTTKELS
ncbi:hypothetical protein FOTG_15868 [Fusarium oxysporum f. sp. vasinfectum 25433]|uniref:Uncharacterized protein n=1 Tax=Fusarium oxysporum f. sp. vasinfectum 25433 TaxID=1089449 RepID=X0L487_FUSOX|nr:hypothetical protein FOTG_15868 [Fusarium oxysporum f. sp. vasinfectum 25433]